MRKICTLLTANGPRYAAIHSECDYFITPAYADIKHAAAAFAWTVEFAQENAAEYVFDMRPAALEQMELSVARLERGESLSDTEAFAVDSMHDFLQTAIAPHLRKFRFLSDELLERWVQELGVRKGRLEDWDTDCLVHDGALWPAVHRRCFELKYPEATYSPAHEVPTEGQNVLAGRYLCSLAYAGKLFGPDCLSPEDIVAEWQGKNRAHALETPSVFSRVLEVLDDAPYLLSSLFDET